MIVDGAVDYDRLVTGEIAAVRENGAGSGIGVLGPDGAVTRSAR